MFYLVDFLRTSSPGGSLSDSSEELLQKDKEEPGYIGILQQKPGSQNIKRLLLIKEKQTSQVKVFSPFLCTGRCKSLRSLQSFVRFAP